MPGVRVARCDHLSPEMKLNCGPAPGCRTRTGRAPLQAGSLPGLKVPRVMPVWPCPPGSSLCQRCVMRAGPSRAPRNRVEQGMTVNEQDKSAAVEQTARRLGRDGQVSQQVLGSLWDEAFEQGRLAALDEFQDRFCVCMK